MHEGCEGGYEKRWSKSDYITARSNRLVEQSTLEFEGAGVWWKIPLA